MSEFDKPNAWAKSGRDIALRLNGTEHILTIDFAHEILTDLRSALWHSGVLADQEDKLREDFDTRGDR